MEKDEPNPIIAKLPLFLWLTIVILLLGAAYFLFSKSDGISNPFNPKAQSASPTPFLVPQVQIAELKTVGEKTEVSSAYFKVGEGAISIKHTIWKDGVHRMEKIEITNPTKKTLKFALLEVVPKTIATIADAFSHSIPATVLKDDPVFLIRFELKPGETKSFETDSSAGYEFGVMEIPINEEIATLQPTLLKQLADTVSRFSSDEYMFLSIKDAAEMERALSAVLNDDRKIEDKITFLNEMISYQELVEPKSIHMEISELLPIGDATFHYAARADLKQFLFKITGNIAESSITSVSQSPDFTGSGIDVYLKADFLSKLKGNLINPFTGQILQDKFTGNLNISFAKSPDEKIQIPIETYVDHKRLISIYPSTLHIFSKDGISPTKKAFAINNLPYKSEIFVGFRSFPLSSSTELSKRETKSYANNILFERPEISIFDNGTQFPNFTVVSINSSLNSDLLEELSMNDVLTGRFVDAARQPKIVSDASDCSNFYCSCVQLKSAIPLKMMEVKQIASSIYPSKLGLYADLFFKNEDFVYFTHSSPIFYYSPEEDNCKIDQLNETLENGHIYLVAITADFSNKVAKEPILRSFLVDTGKSWLYYGFDGSAFSDLSDQTIFENLISKHDEAVSMLSKGK
ncbi:hypothetical protein HY989_01025 [Candidatus Micrarchaeota archaeon]|nr:hypothetical protein [Candidatus Micrarchaeota archaeon]